MAGAISPLIVTAEFGREDFRWLDDLRRQHYPGDRNRVPAHLTLFHSLPPSAEHEVRHLLSDYARSPPPEARIAGVMDLGGGVALRVASDGLAGIRADMADRLRGLLTAQDSAGWSAHVTIQNKVERRAARALIETLRDSLTHGPLRIRGLALHRYLGGPWESLQAYPFRG